MNYYYNLIYKQLDIHIIKMSIIPALCTHLVKEHGLDPLSKTDQRILHTVCFLTMGKSLDLNPEDPNFKNVRVVAGMHGPHLPAVKKWCKSLAKYEH